MRFSPKHSSITPASMIRMPSRGQPSNSTFTNQTAVPTALPATRPVPRRTPHTGGSSSVSTIRFSTDPRARRHCWL